MSLREDTPCSHRRGSSHCFTAARAAGHRDKRVCQRRLDTRYFHFYFPRSTSRFNVPTGAECPAARIPGISPARALYGVADYSSTFAWVLLSWTVLLEPVLPLDSNIRRVKRAGCTESSPWPPVRNQGGLIRLQCPPSGIPRGLCRSSRVRGRSNGGDGRRETWKGTPPLPSRSRHGGSATTGAASRCSAPARRPQRFLRGCVPSPDAPALFHPTHSGCV